MPRSITNVTLVCVDCVDLARAQRAISRSLDQCDFDQVLLLTSLETSDPAAVSIPEIGSKTEYSEFIVQELASYIETDFALIVQHDGWIVDGTKWQDAWLRYDYIGTNCAWTEPGPGGKGGNGGFSLRSRRLLELAAENVWQPSGCDPEDVFFSTSDDIRKLRRRSAFEALGMKFAPRWVQDSFGLNRSIYSGQFGHHRCRFMDQEFPQSNETMLEQQYRKAWSDPSNINQHVPILFDLVKRLGAEHVIELGTQNGISTVAFLAALEHTKGRLTSIDVNAQPDLWSAPNWTFLRGNDLDEEVLAQLAPADLVFIDTSHGFEQTAAELRVYSQLVRPGGCIVCHDTMLEEAGPDRNFPVHRALDSFCEMRKLTWEDSGPWPGLGIIQLPAAQ